MIRVPSRKIKRLCKVVGQTRNWNKDRLDSEEAKRRDLEDELDRERRLVFDLDTRLLQMETQKMELIHQLKVAKQMGASLESHLIFLEEHLANQMVKSHLVFLEEQLLVNSDKDPARQTQLEREVQQQDGAPWKPEKQTLRESKPEHVVKQTEDRETQTEPEKEENQHPLTLMTLTEDDKHNDIVIDCGECETKLILGFVTEQLCFASLQALFNELFVQFDV